MEAYGIIEPIDIESMENAFEALQKDLKVQIQGNHFATLINAYGCVQKDLEKAIEIFDSISSYPRAQPVDAVAFEAMINVLVAHRRTDLIPEYVSKMHAANVHMTAYIANFLIKGYAIVGDLEHARSIFESLVDPPEGIAAPNNHLPHEPAISSTVDHTAPVYREVNALSGFCIKTADLLSLAFNVGGNGTRRTWFWESSASSRSVRAIKGQVSCLVSPFLLSIYLPNLQKIP
jgi:hypothetical protein